MAQRVGNWPGLTVEFNRAKILLEGKVVDIYDLPGIHDLSGHSDDEKLVQTILAESIFDGIVLIFNAAQIDRQLHLVLQLKKLGCPMLLLLNMVDEARDLGIEIDDEKLSEQLATPVVMMAARRGENWGNVRAALTTLVDLDVQHEVPELRDGFARFDESPIAEKRRLIEATYRIQKVIPRTLSTKIDTVLMHPWFGLPIFFTVIALMFLLVFEIGSPLRDLVGEGLAWFKVNVVMVHIGFLPAILQELITEGFEKG